MCFGGSKREKRCGTMENSNRGKGGTIQKNNGDLKALKKEQRLEGEKLAGKKKLSTA